MVSLVMSSVLGLQTQSDGIIEYHDDYDYACLEWLAQALPVGSEPDTRDSQDSGIYTETTITQHALSPMCSSAPLAPDSSNTTTGEIIIQDQDSHQYENPRTQRYHTTTRRLRLEAQEMNPLAHVFIHVYDASSLHDLHKYIHEIHLNNGVIKYFCIRCNNEHMPVLHTLEEAVSHIRYKHLFGKPFLCTTCNTPFTRKQDAVRHVTTMNNGKEHKCSVCRKGFARKDYRDGHEARCLRRGKKHRWVKPVVGADNLC